MNGFNWIKFLLFLFFLAMFGIGLTISTGNYGEGLGIFGAGGLIYLITAFITNYLIND